MKCSQMQHFLLQANPQNMQASANAQGSAAGNMLQTDDKDEDIVF